MLQTVKGKAGEALVAELKNQLDELVETMASRPAMKALLDGSADRDLYVSFLVQTRHYVALSAPYLAKAGDRLKALGRYNLLADLYDQKVVEEAEHEILIDDDIRALGLDAEAALAGEPPGPWVNAYNTWLEAATKGQHPAAYLGSCYLLEGLATKRAGTVAAALQRTGRIANIDKAVSFLDLHAEADIEHVADMDRALSTIEDQTEIDAIATTASATRVAYLGMLDDVAETRKLAA